MYKSSLVTGKKNNNLVCGLKKGKQNQSIPQSEEMFVSAAIDQ